LQQKTIDRLHKILPGASPPPEYRKPQKEKPSGPIDKPEDTPDIPKN
jgi:hypothetical protein